MRIFIAIIFPWLAFFTIGRPFSGIFCLLFQLTFLGWLPATIWAIYSLNQYESEKRMKQYSRNQNV
ncbi:YqaE/Pmp3 family membrane protein [Thorsellia anophelis]|uniref:Proteolipid membrane potential modulator n=1 Tax=Thorsellia anophelis DSM 18579 TaxID=1123402 RepID=A0A1H9ZQM2_9GAMM|nr:YqaE/Pmp3 family membrane protein [Thorsellia anophelis]SES83898.1 Proteolipid membrane potential modulator [Thorsellia anophelis DSM 18579]